MSDSASLSLPRRAAVNPTPLGAALLLILLGTWYLAQNVGARLAALYIVGALLGGSSSPTAAAPACARRC